MAQTWPAKAPTEIVERRWTVPVDADDGLSSFARVASGVTIDAYSMQGNDAVLTLSAGVDNVAATVTLTATTTRGRVLVETFYLPIFASPNEFAYTARDICNFALRKVAGIGTTADAAELSDALERLSDMLAAWKGQGANIGAKLPCAAADVFYISDEFASAVKNNLILEIADLYDYQPSARVINNAQRGLQQIKSSLIDAETRSTVYY
jgi:hypothetical protein